jgi:hypothetical protein
MTAARATADPDNGVVELRLIGAPKAAGEAAARLGELFALDRRSGPYPSRKTSGLVRFYLAGRLRPATAPAPLAAGVRDLLAAVREALSIPYPATVGDHDRYREVLEERATHARIALEHLLKDLEEPDVPLDVTHPWPGVPVDADQPQAATPPEGGAR